MKASGPELPRPHKFVLKATVGSLLFGITACFDVGAFLQAHEVLNAFGLCVLVFMVSAAVLPKAAQVWTACNMAEIRITCN